MTDLRPYQAAVIAEIAAAKERRLLLVAPTGSGKTVIAAAIIRNAINKHVLFLAHRRELIKQARKHLAKFGVHAGVILAGEPTNRMRGVQVASIQTLHARCIRHGQDLPPANIIFIDEAHHAPATTYRTIVERYPDAQIIGMTATPCRRDGRGLGGIFERLIECPQVSELIKLDYLVRTKVYAPSTPDLKGVHTRQGDYVESELAEVMDVPKLVGDIVSHWHRLAERRKTVFATSVAHSIHLCEEFTKSGVKVEHIDGSTPKEQRDDDLARLSRGKIEVVTNCMVLTEGWDQADVSCCILARPTKSMGLYRQMVGRVIRPAPGKDHALILDHAGAVFQHGFVEDPMIWTLDKDTKARALTHEARQRTPSSRLLECSQCHAIRTGGEPCPHCGFMPKRRGEYVSVRDGDLAHLDRDYRTRAHQHSPEQKHQFHRMLAFIGQERGYRPGWASHKFKEKFGHWPERPVGVPIRPNAEVIAWERHCRIKYAKSMQKVAANG